MSTFGNARSEMCVACWYKHGSNPWECFCSCHLPHLDKMHQLYKAQPRGGDMTRRITRIWAACRDKMPENCGYDTFHGGPDGLELAKEACVRRFRDWQRGIPATSRHWDIQAVTWIEERQAPGKTGVLPVYRLYSLHYSKPLDDSIYNEQIKNESRVTKLQPTEHYVETLEMEE